MANVLTMERVFELIREERAYQDSKYGVDKEQSLAGFIAVLRAELVEAEEGWIKNKVGRNSPLHEILQVAATAVACLEKYGATGTTISTDDRQPSWPYEILNQDTP